MAKPVVIVTHDANAAARRMIGEVLDDVADVVHLPDMAKAARIDKLRAAAALITFELTRDLSAAEIAVLGKAKLIQAIAAGVDYLNFPAYPPGVPVASNAGAYAQPMAEHIVAVTMAAAKRLFAEHRKMRDGEFNQFVANRRVAGMTAAILGFGGTGKEVAKLFRCLGVNVQAINRGGATDEDVAFIGTLDDLQRVLAAADIVVITLARTKLTEDIIGARELGWMKEDAILVNVARGEIVNQDALYAHLVAHPDFTACVDAWWIEPFRHGEFRLDHPFLDLANVIASPHNSPMVAGAHDHGARLAAENVRRLLAGEEPRLILRDDERMIQDGAADE